MNLRTCSILTQPTGPVFLIYMLKQLIQAGIDDLDDMALMKKRAGVALLKIKTLACLKYESKSLLYPSNATS
jgi:hypothetical protein